MKKIVSLILAITMSFVFVSCGSAPKINLKESVSTDIVDLTLENSEFTYYVSNVSSNYVEPTEKPNNYYVAKTGTCYVSMTVTITNKDRGGNIDFGGTFADWRPSDWEVYYKGKKYDIYGFDLNSEKYPYISMSNAAYVNKDTGKVISKIGSSNILINAGKTVTIRMFGIIHIDPESLKDGFELKVKVPNSQGKSEKFTYTIPSKE